MVLAHYTIIIKVIDFKVKEMGLNSTFALIRHITYNK